MRRLPPLSAVRAFEAAGRLENFSRAAEELGMTQAAVSYQIRQLETRIGKPLFVRQGGRVKLTDAGRRLLPPISSGFAAMSDAFAMLDEENEDVLAVDCSVSFGGTWLSSRIGRFQLRHPDLAVKLSLSNTLVDFAQGSVDAAVRVGRGKWEGMRADFLFRQHLTPICSPQFVAENRVRSPADLMRVDRHAPNEPMWAGWFAAAGLAEPPPQRSGIILDSQLQEANALLSGYGIALLTPMYWKADLDSGRLVQPFDIVYVPGPAHWLVHPESRRGVRKIERFREWIHGELAADRAHLPPEIWEAPE